MGIGMKEYAKLNRSRILLMGLFVFLIHGAKWNNPAIGIDTEYLIVQQDGFYDGWRYTGRQGLVLLKYLLGNVVYNPYLAGLMTLTALTVAVVAFLLLWDKVLGKSSVLAWVAGGVLWISHPVLTEQFYFTLQSMEVCIGFFLTCIALYLIRKWQSVHKGFLLVGSVAALLLSFSVYQALVPFFIFGAVSVIFLQGLRDYEKEETTPKSMLQRMLPFAGVFITAFLVNTVITALFFGTSNYLSSQILWGRYSIKDIIISIGGHLIRATTGYGSIYYSLCFGLLCLLSLILTALQIRRRKAGPGKAGVLLFYLCALWATPFLMTLICGGAPPIRSQLVLPAITGFLAYLNMQMISSMELCLPSGGWKKKGLTVAASLICVCGIWGQLGMTMRLYYTDRCRYEQDAALGRAVMERMEEVMGGEAYPVIFIGQKAFVGNNACVDGEIIGVSSFDHDTEVYPAYYWSTQRILGLLHTLGGNYAGIGTDRLEEATDYSAGMPAWPDEDSVQLKDGMMIIKLSDSQ